MTIHEYFQIHDNTYMRLKALIHEIHNTTWRMSDVDFRLISDDFALFVMPSLLNIQYIMYDYHSNVPMTYLT